MPTLHFPPGFVWGAATSGYQVEGAAHADGKGESIWDDFVRRPGAVLHGDSGDIACNAHDRRQLDADLDLVAGLGLQAYIFSVQWPRIQPDGRGAANARGLAYYERLVDGLLARGVMPALTLYHWELPLALQRGGGWLNRDTVERFVDYAALLYDALADRVPIWITQNEPSTSAWLGHAAGKHAPGVKGRRNALRAAHHLLLSHGAAVAALRGRAAGARTVFGPVINVVDFRPADPARAADRAAARRLDAERNRLFLDPLFKGCYPRAIGDAMPWLRDGDLDLIATPSDFLGLNYYFSQRVAAGPGGEPAEQPAQGDTTAMGWAVDPDGLGRVLLRLQRGHTGALPVIVSENGASFRDTCGPDGRCHDPERVDYLRRHIAAAHGALRAGVPLKGFFVWSLLDNFEWDSGYRERFGLVHVDYPTQRRTPKDSYGWYRGVVAANASEA